MWEVRKPSLHKVRGSHALRMSWSWTKEELRQPFIFLFPFYILTVERSHVCFYKKCYRLIFVYKFKEFTIGTMILSNKNQ
jgi:hypothetical protein